jgi:hypothetical protein
MVTDREEGVHPPFVGFTVVTQVKPDGRHIHYYEWPPDVRDRAAAPEGASPDASPPPPDAPDV